MDTDHRVQKGSLQWQHLGIDNLRLWLVCMSKLKSLKKSDSSMYQIQNHPPQQSAKELGHDKYS